MRIDLLFDEIAATRRRSEKTAIDCRASPAAPVAARESERHGVDAARHGRAMAAPHALAAGQCGLDPNDVRESGA